MGSEQMTERERALVDAAEKVARPGRAIGVIARDPRDMKDFIPDMDALGVAVSACRETAWTEPTAPSHGHLNECAPMYPRPGECPHPVHRTPTEQTVPVNCAVCGQRFVWYCGCGVGEPACHVCFVEGCPQAMRARIGSPGCLHAIPLRDMRGEAASVLPIPPPTEPFVHTSGYAQVSGELPPSGEPSQNIRVANVAMTPAAALPLRRLRFED